MEYPLKPLPWSFSSLTTYIDCPKKYYHLKIVKDVSDTTGEAASWGHRVHEALEARLRDNVPLPPEFSMYDTYADSIEKRKGEMHIERKVPITKDLTPCEWEDDSAWCRGSIDVLHLDGETAWVLDHKTGKRRPGSKQLALYAIMVFYYYPEIMVCNTAYAWLKTGEKDVATYKREEIPKLWQMFVGDLANYARSFRKGIWPAKQSGLCRAWCPVTSCALNGKNKL